MKYLPSFLVTLLFLAISNLAFAGIYDDWPDDAICTWLEQRPNHKGYLAENNKRKLNCFNRENFSPRNDFDFFKPKEQIYMY